MTVDIAKDRPQIKPPQITNCDRFLGICGITCVLCSENHGKDLSYFSIIIMTYNKFKMNKYGYMNKL